MPSVKPLVCSIKNWSVEPSARGLGYAIRGTACGRGRIGEVFIDGIFAYEGADEVESHGTRYTLIGGDLSQLKQGRVPDP
jgi:hypothetical protein